MRKSTLVRVFPALLGLSAALWLSGCTEPAGSSTDGQPVASDDGHEHHVGDGHEHGDEGHAHTGWWCNEHGIPEAECSMCSSKVAAEFQKKGDWCQEHDRAKSQCFICDPAAKEKYAAKYRAKYGKEPPVIEDEGT
jgi:hypothetical protein